MFAAMDHVPINVLLTGKGNDSEPAGLEDMIRAGVAGLKLHEVCCSFQCLWLT